MKNFKIMLPKDVREQEKIIAILNKKQEIIQNEKIQISKLHALKSGLMQDLLTGKVRV